MFERFRDGHSLIEGQIIVDYSLFYFMNSVALEWQPLINEAVDADSKRPYVQGTWLELTELVTLGRQKAWCALPAWDFFCVYIRATQFKRRSKVGNLGAVMAIDVCATLFRSEQDIIWFDISIGDQRNLV